MYRLMKLFFFFFFFFYDDDIQLQIQVAPPPGTEVCMKDYHLRQIRHYQQQK